MKAVSFLRGAVCLTLLLTLPGCAQKTEEETAVPATADLPYGTWQVVDLSRDLPGDVTAILILDRFTFSWTTLVPSQKAIYYEAGDVTYSTQERRMTFRVKTAKVMDQTSDIPKEVFEGPRMEELRHAPGDQYHMKWGVGKNDVLVLNGPKTEVTYLRKLKAGPADSTVIDVQKEGKN
jgi:hypothetical protein